MDSDKLLYNVACAVMVKEARRPTGRWRKLNPANLPDPTTGGLPPNPSSESLARWEAQPAAVRNKELLQRLNPKDVVKGPMEQIGPGQWRQSVRRPYETFGHESRLFKPFLSPAKGRELVTLFHGTGTDAMADAIQAGGLLARPPVEANVGPQKGGLARQLLGARGGFGTRDPVLANSFAGGARHGLFRADVPRSSIGLYGDNFPEAILKTDVPPSQLERLTGSMYGNPRFSPAQALRPDRFLSGQEETVLRTLRPADRPGPQLRREQMGEAYRNLKKTEAARAQFRQKFTPPSSRLPQTGSPSTVLEDMQDVRASLKSNPKASRMRSLGRAGALSAGFGTGMALAETAPFQRLGRAVAGLNPYGAQTGRVAKGVLGAGGRVVDAATEAASYLPEPLLRGGAAFQEGMQYLDPGYWAYRGTKSLLGN